MLSEQEMKVLQLNIHSEKLGHTKETGTIQSNQPDPVKLKQRLAAEPFSILNLF